MMGMGYARNMYSDLQEIMKYCKKLSSRWNFLKLIHDARNDKHKTYCSVARGDIRKEKTYFYTFRGKAEIDHRSKSDNL
jgi:hypothetical protein